MRIAGKNIAVTTVEDVISKGGTITIPTEARLHNIASTSSEDDSNGSLQIETATIVGTIEAAGAGNAKLVVTGALVAGSPLTIAFAVANNDTAAQVAGKARTALNIAAITTNYTVSGSGAEIILTTKAIASNDTSLNIESDNDTCAGLTHEASSANTQAGGSTTGARTVKISGIDDDYREASETVTMNGVSNVSTVNKYFYINKMEVLTTGSTGNNVGTISATAATDATLTNQIEPLENISKQAIYMNDTVESKKVTYFDAHVFNATSGAVTTIYVYTKKHDGLWTLVNEMYLNSSLNHLIKDNEKFLPELEPKEMVKFGATVSAGTSLVNINFDVN